MFSFEEQLVDLALEVPWFFNFFFTVYQIKEKFSIQMKMPVVSYAISALY